MSLVGRHREMLELAGLLDRAEAGTGGLLVVTGPAGVGKTAVVEAGIECARRRGFHVVRAAPAAGQPGRMVWAQLVRDVGAPDELAARLLAADAGPLDLDEAARQLTAPSRLLIVIDDVDRGGRDAIELLAVLASRAAAGATAVIASAVASLGTGRELLLRGLTEGELAEAVGELRADARYPLWVASRGLPGLARILAADLSGLDPETDPIVHLALHTASSAAFLDLDVALIRLLEIAVPRARDDGTRARLLARLAGELLGDASAGTRRRQLADEAVALADRDGDPRTVAEVLDAALHAVWDPAAAEGRLAAAARIVELARACRDGNRERRGMFWRFVALMELGRVGAAESALAVFERAATAAGDGEAAVMVAARHAMLAILRGRFDEAARLIDEVAELGRRAELADTEQLVATLRGPILAERGQPSEASAAVAVLLEAARHRPGHFYEATAAYILAMTGRESDAGIELERLLPRALAGSGPRWVGAIAHLAAVANATRNDRAAAALYHALLPYRGHLVVWGGANTAWGPVCHYLGLLATTLDRLDTAIGHLDEAVALEEEIGALPSLAHTLAALAEALAARGRDGDAQRQSQARGRARSIAHRLGMTVLLGRLVPPADEWTLARDGGDWLLAAGEERARLRDIRGLHYLRALLAAPGREIAALDLIAGGAGLRASDPGPVLDAAARAAYRRRLAELDAELAGADQRGDQARSASAGIEREALVGEVSRASGLGGRPRQVSAEAERARVNVTRTLRSTLDRIAAVAPQCGAYLHASIRTGRMCRYEPAPSGPARWHV